MKQSTIKESLKALYYVQANLGGSEDEITEAISDLLLNLNEND